MNEKFIRDIFRTAKLKCDECGQYYTEDDIEIIKEDDGSCYLNIYCSTCNRRSFAIALFKEEEVKIDHIDEHIKALSTQKEQSVSINTNDVSAIHTFLDTFDGDFDTLFNHSD